MTFAKVFGTDEEQILVKIDTDEDGCPEVRFYCKPDGMGVSSVAIGFEDDDNGWDLAEAAFEAITEESAKAAVKSVYDFLE